MTNALGNSVRLLCLAGSLFLCITGLAACGDSSVPEADADPLDQRGQWTFVNYWAEWCKPCIQEIPELNALHELEGYRVLGVNFDGARGEALEAQLSALGVAFPTLAEDPAQRFELARPQVLPTTLVLTPDGDLAKVLVGPQTEESLLEWTRQLSPGEG
ncbi:MAG: TlpA disulfide reductase family protein [Congregibacter sp.]